MTLSACARSGAETPRPSVPSVAQKIVVSDLDAADRQKCYDPGLPDGEDGIVSLTKTRLALGECARKHLRVVSKFDKLRNISTAPDERGNFED